MLRLREDVDIVGLVNLVVDLLIVIHFDTSFFWGKLSSTSPMSLASPSLGDRELSLSHVRGFWRGWNII